MVSQLQVPHSEASSTQLFIIYYFFSDEPPVRARQPPPTTARSILAILEVYWAQEGAVRESLCLGSAHVGDEAPHAVSVTDWHQLLRRAP